MPSDLTCPLAIVQDNNLAVVRFAVEALDESNLEPLGSELDRLAAERGRRLHLDLGGVRMVCSTWLCRFVVLSKRLGSRGGELVLFNAGPEVREEFEITRLDEMLDVRW